ncbi:MAG: AbrB/MazE/SpoVT family DNA-binding domain-containing protein [Candidatus Acidiferrum sp.]
MKTRTASNNAAFHLGRAVAEGLEQLRVAKEKHRLECQIVENVKVSAKFQIVIPRQIREELKLKPGELLELSALDASICLKRLPPIDELHGIAKGLKWKDEYRDH